MVEVVVEVATSLYARLVGRRWQRRRAERLIRRGKVRCALSDVDRQVLPGGSADGVADVSSGRLRMHGAELWVRAIEGPAAEGPIDPFAHDGRFHPPDGNLVFEPATRGFTLRLHNDTTVRWTVLAFQAEEALALLGLHDEEPKLGG